MRRARYKSPQSAFYHVVTRVAGSPRYFPLQQRVAWRKLGETIHRYIGAYGCRLLAYEIMGNHYHLILYVEAYRRLSLSELRRRAAVLYGRRAEVKTASWSLQAWQQFNRKLFDLSSLMQQINGEYAKWFNRHFDRRGHLWADRYKNPQLLDRRALQECLFYVELNAVRARLVRRPGQWKAGSAYLRWQRRDQDLMPLEEIFPEIDSEQVRSFYRYHLYERGAMTTQDRPGRYRRRLRFFTDGLAIGNRLSVSRRLDQWRAQGFYRRRKKPIAQLDGFLFTLREQRSHARI